jgi:hypothetical protein
MTLPFISCICPTYGRSQRLSEAIACFLSQDYAGPKELLVLNSFTKQNIQGEFPNVFVRNLPERPQSLGECRNLCIAAARGEIIVTWDDDDLYLPHYLSLVAAHYKDGIDWAWMSKQFYADGFKIQEVMQGQLNSVSFRKSAWEKIGGYDQLTVGEDRNFVSKLTAQTKGVKVPLLPKEIGFIYSWGNNTYKTSGYGDDKPSQMPAHDRVAHEVRQACYKNQEPTGKITLVPRLEHDPVRMAESFLNAHGLLVEKQNSVCIVELGRFGDIVNILPIAKHVHDTFGKPHFMVSREFASVLEGVSYVTPYIVDLKNDEINEAMKIARREFKYVIQTQIWGKNYTQQKLCRSYNEESWRMGGFWHRFNDKSMRPLFDLRDKDREAALLRSIVVTGKRLLLVNVTKSISSPFPQGAELLGLIIDRCATEFEIIDMARVNAERIYDILGLMDQAAALVSIDTALLHFAAATEVKTLGIVNSEPWAGSILRGNSFTNCKVDYAEAKTFPMNIAGNIIPYVSNTWAPKEYLPLPPITPLQQPPTRRLFHCVERHNESNPAESARKKVAWDSWDVLYNKGVIPCHTWEPYDRDARGLGDRRPLPFLKDILKNGMDQAGYDDIIFWSNDDNILHPELSDLLTFHCAVYEVCTSRRMEFRKNPFPKQPNLVPEEYARLGEHHIGRDIFAATKRWLVTHWDHFPDVVLGEPLFDLHLAAMVRLYFNYKSDKKSLFNDNIFPCELPLGYCSHIFHTPKWTQEQRMTHGRRRNSEAFKAFAGMHGLPLVFTAGGDI